MDAGCSDLPALASEAAKASTAGGAWSYAGGFRPQYCDVRCDSLARNTLCTATKPSSDAYDDVDGIEGELSSPDGGAATLWRLSLVGNLCRDFSQGISAPDGTICKSEVEGLKPHGRGRELFTAVHDICGVTCTCGVAEVVGAGCSNLPALATKASTADGAWSCSDGFRAQYCPHGAACDVPCDSLERNTLCTATKPSSAAKDDVDGIEGELSSPDGGAAALWQGKSAPDGTVSDSGVEAGILGTSWAAGLEFAGVWEPLPRDLKPHGRGHKLFVAIHDVCGATNLVSDGAMVNICGSASPHGKDGVPRDWQRLPFAGKQLDNGRSPTDPDLRQLTRCKVEGFGFDPGGSAHHPGYRE